MKVKAKILIVTIALFFVQFVQSQESAKVVLDKAYNKAKIENKNLFVMFKASWCGWCKKLEANMNQAATQKIFTDNYIIVQLDVKEREGKKNLENPGAIDLLKKYKAEGVGIPFFLIFDAYGKKLTDSFDAKGQNLGCPASPEEVNVFIKKLKETSTLLDSELATIARVFQKK